jgi:hypothetical protein
LTQVDSPGTGQPNEQKKEKKRRFSGDSESLNDSLMSLISEPADIKAIRQETMQADLERKMLENKIATEKWELDKAERQLQLEERRLYINTMRAAAEFHPHTDETK